MDKNIVNILPSPSVQRIAKMIIEYERWINDIAWTYGVTQEEAKAMIEKQTMGGLLSFADAARQLIAGIKI